MPAVDLPTTWLGLLGLVVVMIGSVAIAALPVVIPLMRRQRRIGGDLRDVKNQIQNGHPATEPKLVEKVDTSVAQNCELLEKVGYLTATVESVRDELKAQHVRIARLEHPERRGW